MKTSEVLVRVMAGELLLVGEFRGGRAERRDYVNTKSGQKIPRLCITYIAECAIQGVLRHVKIVGIAPDGVTDPNLIEISLKKGKRYGFFIEKLDRRNDLANAWIGKSEPFAIEDDAEISPSGVPSSEVNKELLLNLVYNETTPQP